MPLTLRSGHHAFQHRAVLGAVHALRIRFDPAFRGAFGHGRRLRAAHEQGLCVMAKTMRSRGTMRVASMSIQVTFKDGVFEPLEDAIGVHPGQHYTVFSDQDLHDIRGTLG